jgi:phospholipase C
VTAPTDDAASAARAACTYKAGALPKETQGASRPNGADIPIDHIVVAMMENRSFDHYFQKARDVGLDVDVAPDGFTNPDATGNPIAPFHDTAHCFLDTAHSWNDIRTQINGGKMDGFISTNEANHELPAHGTPDMLKGNRAMAYYTQDDIPFAYWMAQNFAIGDRYFASAPTATWPNRMFLFAATSFGEITNEMPTVPTPTIFDSLNQRQVSWKFYATTTPTLAILLSDFLSLRNADSTHFATMDDYYADLAAGTLPQVAFIDPDGTETDPSQGGDEHPPAPSTVGQNWLNKAVAALAASSAWSRSAMFITYDEHGGLFDHVVPPAACAPEGTEPTPDADSVLRTYGIRVPFFALSPYAKKAYVSHRTYDHTSIVRFIESRFVIPALSDRDANAEAPWDAFDFTTPPAPAPNVPTFPVDAAIVAACRAVWD